jgi:hypothetical protein
VAYLAFKTDSTSTSNGQTKAGNEFSFSHKNLHGTKLKKDKYEQKAALPQKQGTQKQG